MPKAKIKKARKKAVNVGRDKKGRFVSLNKNKHRGVFSFLSGFLQTIFLIYFIRKHPRIFLFLTIVFISLSVTFYVQIIKDLPSPESLRIIKPKMTTIIRDRNRQVLYRVYKNANRVNLPWEQIPDVVKNATVAIEDSEFYSHRGISLKSIIRALMYNIKQTKIDDYQGASTITQQLVKNRFFSTQKSYRRKMKEIFMAIWTETKFTKEEILTMYLNEVGFGGPAYGVEAASQMYFGIGAQDLNLAQAALLAGLPKAPTTFSPFGVNSGLAIIRQRQVLDRMLKLGFIQDEEYEEALSLPLSFAPQRTDILAPHFVMFVKDELVKKLGEETVEEGGLDVVTTLDLVVQQKAQEIVAKNIAEIKDKYSVRNGAVLVTNPQTGEILAMVGSTDFFDLKNHGYVNVTTRRRQPGSAIKVVNYAYAFDHGFTPNTVVDDSPVVYTAPGTREIYKPVNYDGKFHGNVTIRTALGSSYNIPAVKTLNRFGIPNMIKTGQDMGIQSWDNLPPIGLSLTLGGAEVTMLDMARVFGTLNNLGQAKELTSIVEIIDNNQNNITEKYYENSRISLVGEVEAANRQVISPLSAYWLTDILADNNARIPAFGRYAKLTVPNHKVAVKTGTSNNFRDNWTIGFTPDFLVAAWVGNNDGSFMNKNLVSGITGAAPIWNDTMSFLLQDKIPQEFPKPAGLIPVKICAVGGLLTCPNCPSEKVEYFTADKVPTQKCFFKSSFECDAARVQSEGKSDEEKKNMLFGCPPGIPVKQ